MSKYKNYSEYCKGLASAERNGILQSLATGQKCDNACAYAVNAYALAIQGQLNQSARLYQKALSIDSSDQYIVADFIQVLLGSGNISRARRLAKQAVTRFPESADCHLVAANAAFQAGDTEATEQHLHRVLSIKPNSATAALKLSSLLTQRNAYKEALYHVRIAAEHQPDNVDIHNQLGHILHTMGQPAAAIEHFRTAVGIRPEWAMAWYNLGRAYTDSGQPLQALPMYEQAILHDPANAIFHGCLATELLKMGQWEKGWSAFEWRFDAHGRTPQRDGYNAPVWDGRLLQGERVMVWMEQGLGDNLQFFRFTRHIHERGGKVWLQAPPQCAKLYRACGWIEKVVTAEHVDPSFDYQIPLMSLPATLKLNSEQSLTSDIPYLHAPEHDAKALREITACNVGYKVGIVWASSQANDARFARDCPLENLLPLCGIKQTVWYSFQYGSRTADLQACNAEHVIDLSAHISDFAATAAFIAAMDLVITVDTAMAHLAGALGAKTWVLLGEPCDWRWLYERVDSPWYPRTKLFRQPEPGDWESVIKMATDALAVEIENHH